MNVLTATELYTWLILCYVNFTSVRIKNEKTNEIQEVFFPKTNRSPAARPAFVFVCILQPQVSGFFLLSFAKPSTGLK